MVVADQEALVVGDVFGGHASMSSSGVTPSLCALIITGVP